MAAMTKQRPIRILALIFLTFSFGAERMHASGRGQSRNAASIGSAQQATPDLRGTWSGTFISTNSDIAPFTITVKINQDAGGHLVGDASLVSDCLNSHRLHVKINGSNVELAGSDGEGDTVIFRGTADDTGTVLRLNYLVNGSPSGRCEIDDGTGTMGKR
jgi:hypothetical protein